MRVNEDLFPSCMAKVDNKNKCVESEKLNSRMTDKLGDTDYKVQNSVSRSKDGDQCEEEHSFEKPHEEEAPAIKKKEAKISLTEWVKNIKLTSCPYIKEEPERSGSMEIVMFDGHLPRMINILFFQPKVVDGWRLQRQGRRWFLGIIIAHLPKILFRNIGCLEFIFRGSQVIKRKKLLLRIIDYLEIIFPGIQVDRVATALDTAADED